MNDDRTRAGLPAPSADDCAVTLVVPVYDTGEVLLETLASIAQQTLDRSRYEVIVVDDGSRDARTLAILNEVRAGRHLGAACATVIVHEANRSLPEARNTGVRAARGRYVCCLDGDDLIEPVYLKKAMLLLEASPAGAGWVYPGVRKFGHADAVDEAPEFRAFQLFLENYCVAASVVRKSMWEHVGGQRLRMVTPDVPWFEDWDFWIRAMAKGWYGVPLREPLFRYRIRLRSLMTRDPQVRRLTRYLVQRHNALRLLQIGGAQSRCRQDQRAGRAGSPTSLGLRDLPDRIAGKAISSVSQRAFHVFPWTTLVLAAASPRRFIERELASPVLPTWAERQCGFEAKPRWAPADLHPRPASQRTMLFAHNYWRTGGAQRVLLEWMRAANGIEGTRIIEVVGEAVDPGGGPPQNARLCEAFGAIAHERHALDRVAPDPLTALRYCWELLLLERPQLLFIMSNPFFYALAPFVKRALPDTVVVDLLHNEEHGQPGWFGTAYEYRAALDARLVVSEYWKQVLVDRYAERAERVHVAMNGVDLQHFDAARYDRDELRQRAGLDAQRTVVAFVGRLEPQKGPEVFVELAQRMADEPAYSFVMVGGGSLEPTIRERTRELGNLRLYGEVSDAAPFYALADVIVVPSVYEGYPLVAIEAAAMNRPIIGTDIPGLREPVSEGRFGVLYQRSSPAADAETIRQMLHSHAFDWQDLGQRGRDFVRRRHDLDRQRGLYGRILGGLLTVPVGHGEERSDEAIPPDALGGTDHGAIASPVARHDGQVRGGSWVQTTRRRVPSRSDVLFFLHIPKAGGTSVSDLLKRNYPGQIMPAESDVERRHREFNPSRARAYRVVSGHYDFSIVRRMPDLVPFTIMRHPVARFVSAMRYAARTNDEWNRALYEQIRRTGLNLAQLARDPSVMASQSNFQTLQIAGYRWSGERVPPPDELLAMAKSNLDRFVFVGLTEQFEDSIRLLAWTLGWEMPKEVPRLNMRPDGETDGALDESTRAAIAALNRLDLELYAHAERRFVELRTNALRELLAPAGSPAVVNG